MGCCLSCANLLANMGESANTPDTAVDSNTDGRTGSETGSGATASKIAKVFSYGELTTATKGFRSKLLLGRGSFGCVYKGQLRNGQDVAVKLLDKNSQQGDQEFFAEVEKLSLLHHPNLVTLIGYCSERDQRVLVYEYMPLGSLENHLYDVPLDREPLDWNKRMKIATGVAKGLEYLHVCADQPVIFRDFKSSNILLGEDYHPKLSDFGMAKFVPLGDSSHGSTQVVGTEGYCAPEYVVTGHLTPKCDVYSFGVVLLELISGRKVIDKSRSPNMRNLVTWARPLFKDRKQFHRLVDPLLHGYFPLQGLYQAIAIAAMCLHKDADRRPVIRDVVTALTYLESQYYDPNKSNRSGPSCSLLSPSPSAETFDRKENGLDKLQKKHESQRGSSGCAADTGTGTARETPGNPDVDIQPAAEESGEKSK